VKSFQLITLEYTQTIDHLQFVGSLSDSENLIFELSRLLYSLDH
jgi:hypothetical protein